MKLANYVGITLDNLNKKNIKIWFKKRDEV